MMHELGDVAFYFAKVLELTGHTLEEVLQANKEKLESRHPELGKVAARFSDGYIK
jgi:NTP pyrophosphatase (non-canonical NTP hydrolase)